MMVLAVFTSQRDGAGEDVRTAKGQRGNTPGSVDVRAVPGMSADIVLDGRIYYEESNLREEVISKCMERSGYPYQPNPPVVVSSDGSSPSHLSDPNEMYTSSLSPELLELYYLAFAGVPDANAPDIVPIEHREDGGGCLGLAHRLVPGLYRVDRGLTGGAAKIRQGSGPSNVPGCLERELGLSSPQQRDEALYEGAISVEDATAAGERCTDEDSPEAQDDEARVIAELQTYIDARPDAVASYLEVLDSGRQRAAEYLAS